MDSDSESVDSIYLRLILGQQKLEFGSAGSPVWQNSLELPQEFFWSGRHFFGCPSGFRITSPRHGFVNTRRGIVGLAKACKVKGKLADTREIRPKLLLYSTQRRSIPINNRFFRETGVSDYCKCYLDTFFRILSDSQSCSGFRVFRCIGREGIASKQSIILESQESELTLSSGL